MKIENGRIKPCSTCLKARQRAKDMFQAAISKRGLYTLVECSHGSFEIHNGTHEITGVSRDDWIAFVGKVVYLAGKTIYDVNAAKPIGIFGSIVKTEKSDNRVLTPNGT